MILDRHSPGDTDTAQVMRKFRVCVCASFSFLCRDLLKDMFWSLDKKDMTAFEAAGVAKLTSQSLKSLCLHTRVKDNDSYSLTCLPRFVIIVSEDIS